MTDRITDLRRHANDHDRAAEGLVARYGTGIRPAWVGEEIAIHHHRAALARDEADRLAVSSHEVVHPCQG